MIRYKEVKQWFYDLANIIFDTNLSIDIMRSIAKEPSDITEDIVKSTGFFFQVSLQSRFTIYVQLCKVLDENDNQKRNFIKLFTRLSSESYDKEFKNHLRSNTANDYLLTTKAEIIQCVTGLRVEINKHKELIERVVRNRNKVYAHSHPNADVPYVSDDELLLLINLCNRIYNDFNLKLFDNHMGFEYTEDWMPDKIINDAVTYRRNELEKFKLSIINKAPSEATTGFITDHLGNIIAE
jgi:hypothetical protein